MKNRISLLLLLLSSCFAFSQTNDEPSALGLPGDNLNLYAVLDIFQKSPTLEGFESALNDKAANVNNLDLNNDNTIDYLKVTSQQVNNTHTIVIQDIVNREETQDVAVIIVSKEPHGKTTIQIIGDQELYGKYYIVEPADQNSGTPNPGYNSSANVAVINNYQPIEKWVIVTHLYSPSYVIYNSPFYWGYYPGYWNPWRPIFYLDYWGYHHHYYREAYYRRGFAAYSPFYRTYYGARRIHSAVVLQNHRNGAYAATYNGRTFRKIEPASANIRSPRNGNNMPRSIGSGTVSPRINNVRTTAPRVNSPRVNTPRSTSPRVHVPRAPGTHVNVPRSLGRR